MDPGDPAGFTTSRANGFPFNKFRCFLLRERGGQAKNWVAKHVGGEGEHFKTTSAGSDRRPGSSNRNA